PPFTRLDTSKRPGQIATNPWGRRPPGTPYIGGLGRAAGVLLAEDERPTQAWRKAGRPGAGLDSDVESSHSGSMADPYVDRRDQMFPKLTAAQPGRISGLRARRRVRSGEG